MPWGEAPHFKLCHTSTNKVIYRLSQPDFFTQQYLLYFPLCLIIGNCRRNTVNKEGYFRKDENTGHYSVNYVKKEIFHNKHSIIIDMLVSS